MQKALAVAALLLASAGIARADSMRCGTHLVPDTASLEQTLSECGAPTTRETRVEHERRAEVGKRGQVTIYEQDVVVDVLRYDFGPNAWLYELVFRGGQMASMQKRGRGQPR